MSAQIDAAVREQGRLQQRLSQALQVIHETVRETITTAAPLLRQAAEVLRERQALNAVRAQLLDHRMGEWRKMQTQNNGNKTEQAAQKRFSQEIGSMPKPISTVLRSNGAGNRKPSKNAQRSVNAQARV